MLALKMKKIDAAAALKRAAPGLHETMCVDAKCGEAMFDTLIVGEAATVCSISLNICFLGAGATQTACV